jgi:hypothetical protein
MAFVLERDPPCGKCPGCLLLAEVTKMLEFIDKRYRPMLESAAQEVTDARWHRSEERRKTARRAYDQRLEDYLHQRAKILTPEILRGSQCTVSGARLVGAPDVPVPAEVSARPREVADATRSRSSRCARCGATAEDGLILPHLTVCAGCFGFQ